jgi:hypothetical protein
MKQLRKAIREFVEEFLSEEYPTNFSFEEFDNIKSYNGKLKYANERLEKLGSGSARVVYKVDNQKVLKIAKNKKGIAQNSVEAEGYLQNYDIVARVFDTDRDDFWVEMEWAKKLSQKRFEQLTGLKIESVTNYLIYKKSYQNYNNKPSPEIKDFLQKSEENEFIQNLWELIADYNMIYPGDFTRISSYGEVTRDGKQKVVLVDFGLTSSVYYDYYDRRNR